MTLRTAASVRRRTAESVIMRVNDLIRNDDNANRVIVRMRQDHKDRLMLLAPDAAEVMQIFVPSLTGSVNALSDLSDAASPSPTRSQHTNVLHRTRSWIAPLLEAIIGGSIFDFCLHFALRTYSIGCHLVKDFGMLMDRCNGEISIGVH